MSIEGENLQKANIGDVFEDTRENNENEDLQKIIENKEQAKKELLLKINKADEFEEKLILIDSILTEIKDINETIKIKNNKTLEEKIFFEGSMSEFNSKIRKLEESKKNIEEDNIDVTNNIENLEKELINHKEEKKDLQEQVKKFEKDIENIKELIKEQNLKIAEINEITFDDLANEIDEKEDELDIFEEDIEKVHQMRKSLKIKSENEEKQKKDFDVVLEDLRNTENKLLKMSDEYDGKINKFRNILSERNKEFENLFENFQNIENKKKEEKLAEAKKQVNIEKENNEKKKREIINKTNETTLNERNSTAEESLKDKMPKTPISSMNKNVRNEEIKEKPVKSGTCDVCNIF